MADKVGCLGGSVSFGYMAAEKYFSEQDVEMVSYKSHYKICKAVGMGNVDYGVVAIENVIDGTVVETIHAVEHNYRKYDLHVFAEIVLPIEIFHLQKSDAECQPTKVLSHHVAIRQCQKYVASLQEKGIALEYTDSTEKAAEEAAKKPKLSALASEKAETVYPLKRLVNESVADNKRNYTRFWVLSSRHNERTGEDKTCIFINLEQKEAGVLAKALNCFAEHEVNLLTIHPNPIPGRKWEYTFVLEFEGHIFDEGMDAAYESLNDSGLCVGGPLVLGSYPVAV